MLNFAAVALRGNGMSFNRNRDSLLSAAETERGTRAGNTASRHRSPEAAKPPPMIKIVGGIVIPFVPSSASAGS